MTLSNERVSLSSAGSLWELGLPVILCLNLSTKRRNDRSDTAPRVSSFVTGVRGSRLNRLRTLSARLAGKTPGAEASIQKAMADDHGQHVLEMAKKLTGASGMLEGSGPEERFLRWDEADQQRSAPNLHFSRTLTRFGIMVSFSPLR